MNKIDLANMTNEELKKAAKNARKTLTKLHIQMRRRVGDLEELKQTIFRAQEVLGVIEDHLFIRKLEVNRHSSRKCIPI